MTFIPGIHHITGISGSAAENLDFYTRVLGLRLVKKTVNFDDPGTYHLYFGDEIGRPGTIMTFFPFPDAIPGRAGAGMAMETAFSIPKGALDFWAGRFADMALDFELPPERFGDRVLTLSDPHGLKLALVEDETVGSAPSHDGFVPEVSAIRGFHSMSIASRAPHETSALLMSVMGFHSGGEEDGRKRFHVQGDSFGRIIDILPPGERGRPGSGTIHHIAFRSEDAACQLQWKSRLEEAGMMVTPVQDRQYFESIYFREPGGILFEIATDGPGFTRDESPERLGTGLMLPPWFEPRREAIESRLTPLTT